MKEILFTTSSKSKINDITYLVNNCFGRSVLFTSLPELCLPEELDAPEDCDTVVGNANQKLKFYYNYLTDNGIASRFDYIISEDTGLFINALNGEPGVKTARFSGSHDYRKTNEKILSLMTGVNDRSCIIESCISVIKVSNGELKYFNKKCDGVILEDESRYPGFAFDTIVKPLGSSFSFSELDYMGKLSRIIKLPRTNAFITSMDYILTNGR